MNSFRLTALLGAVATLLIATAPTAAAQSTGWQPGPGAILDNTYQGSIDTPTSGAVVPASGSFAVAGWFVDTQAEGWAGVDNIQVWLGTMDGGGHELAGALIAQNRPDVAAALNNPYWAASGFVAALPGASVPGGPQTLYVYAHTGGKGWWWKSVNVNGGGSGSGSAATAGPAGMALAAGGGPTLTIQDPQPNQNVSTRSTFTVDGSVSDPANVDRIQVWIDGERDTQYATLLGTTTPNSDGSWMVVFTPTHFPSTHTNLYIYAHDKATGQETEVSVGFNIFDPH